MAFAQLFGDVLLTKDGEKSTEEVLAGKTSVGIYFSAHWCPPCRGFTPKLAEMYKDAFMDKGMEIVFVSSDKDEAAFGEYFGEQPWVALPYAKRDIKNTLSKKFKVSGIPSLVIIGPDGATITTDGRAAVSEDPSGTKYPWVPPTPAEKAKAVLDTLGPELLQKISGKPIGLYFSAHWCPPCRGFTPKLAEYYNAGLKDKMEIIFVSSDRDQESFNEYSKEMPWLALPYEKRDEKSALSKAFGVGGIPCFVVLNADGTLVTTDGRACVEKDPSGQDFPEGWLPQPFNDVNEDPSDLNGEQCVIAIGGDEKMCTVVKQLANEYYAAAGKQVDAMPLRFYTAPAGGITDQLRKLTALDGDKLILLDIPSDGAFYVYDNQEISVGSIKGFINDALAGKVPRQQLKK
jgi:nucleoredoxin